MFAAAVPAKLFRMHSDPRAVQAQDDITAARYKELCERMGYFDPPRLDTGNRPALHGRFDGLYDFKRHLIWISPLCSRTDDVLLHELVHAAARRTGGYFGRHGAPFLALLRLATWYYGRSNRRLLAGNVRRNWSKLALPSYRKREITRAWRSASRIRKALHGSAGPYIAELASRVRDDFPTRVQSLARPWNVFPVADLLQTQHNGLRLTLWRFCWPQLPASGAVAMLAAPATWAFLWLGLVVEFLLLWFFVEAAIQSGTLLINSACTVLRVLRVGIRVDAIR